MAISCGSVAGNFANLEVESWRGAPGVEAERGYLRFAPDGGYVLIGVRELDMRWFEEVEWGTSTVYADTVARFDLTGANWQHLAVLQDIDRPEDLPLWRAIVQEGH